MLGVECDILTTEISNEETLSPQRLFDYACFSRRLFRTHAITYRHGNHSRRAPSITDDHSIVIVINVIRFVRQFIDHEQFAQRQDQTRRRHHARESILRSLLWNISRRRWYPNAKRRADRVRT